MSCLLKKMYLFVIPVLSFVLLSVIPSSTYAIDDYLSISLSPSSGIIYRDYSVITVSLNSGASEYQGVDYTLSFTGDVKYLGITGSSVCGDNMIVTPGSGTINVACVYIPPVEGAVYNGVVSTLRFQSTGTGSSVFTFSGSTDPNIITKTGATYTLSAENNPAGTTGALPDSGIFDDTRSIVVIGVFLILVGLFFNQLNSFALLFLQRVKESKVKYQEKRVNERRDKLEKKF